MLGIILKRRPLLGRAGIKQLTKYDCPDVRILGHNSDIPARTPYVCFPGVNRKTSTLSEYFVF